MPNRAAVVIGINYDTLPSGVHPDATKSAGINRLRYAEADARDVAALLTNAGYDVKLLTGVAATQRAIINTIVRQRRAAGPDGFLLIHYSGHGDVDPDDPLTAYLLPADTDPDALAASGIALDYLVQRHLSGVKSALALLDCCHSGYALGWRSSEDTGERGRAFLAQAEATFNHAHGRVVLAACAGAASTRELGELEHGAFTYYFLDYWHNHPAEVSIGSLFDNIDKGLDSLHLPRPVHGGTYEGRMVLRSPIARPAPTDANPILPPSDAERREKLFNAINELNDTNWAALLATVGFDTNKLAGSTRAAKTLSLIRAMIVEGLFGVLEQVVREQVARQVETAQQIADLLAQLVEADLKQEWNRVIDLGERILNLDAQHQPTRSKTAAAYNRWGVINHNQKAYDRAIADYNRALELDPQQANYYFERGKSYHAKGDYDRAIADKSRAIELAPQQADYYRERGVSYGKKGDYARAIADYNRAIDLDPQQADNYWERGKCYTWKGDYDRAIADYNRAIELNTHQVSYYDSRSTSYHSKGDNDRAIADKSHGIELDPQQADYYYSRGLSYHEKGDYDRAIADKSRAIKLDPQQALYWQQRGVSYHQKGDYDRAIADYNRAIELAPQQADYYKSRGVSYYQKGDYDRAIADYNRAIKLAPQQADYYRERGVSYHMKGEYDQAIADYNRAIELAPREGEYYRVRGLAYKLKGNPEAARRDFRRAVELGYTQARKELASL